VLAVAEVDIALHSGRTLALVGESGSGKSTVARMLAQLMPPSSGVVRLHGSTVKVRSSRDRRRYVGEVQLLLQDPFASLNPVHTIRFQLGRVVALHRRAKKTSMEETLHELLRTVHLSPPEDFLDKFPHELSGGQLQRIAIARTLAAQPQVLLLDEPVSMLDVSIRLGVLNLLRELKDDSQLGMLYITHDIASARYFADEIQVMYRGHVVEIGPAEQVTQSPVHPYTQLLIASSPDPRRRLQERQDEGGAVPDARAAVSSGGCPFAARCPHTMAVCSTMPPKTEVAQRHIVRCWLNAPSHGDPTGTAGRAIVPVG
jgi:peptide/nickel transport system ATP-binding protein